MLRSARLASLVLLLVVPPAFARTWYITPDGTGDAPTIQAGIDSAVVGDIVELACGTYLENDLLLTSGVTLRSATGVPDCATIDGRDAGRILSCHDAEIAPTLEGITFTRGNAGWAAALDCYRTSLRVSRCAFVANTAEYGGAVSCYETQLDCTDCLFDGNLAIMGGAVYVDYESRLEFTGCVFRHNVADYPWEYQRGGGAVFARYGSVEFDHCTLVENTADRGSAVGGQWASASFTRCVLAYNRGCEPVWLIPVDEISCTDVFGNDVGDFIGVLEGHGGLAGNFSADPLFCDTEGGDLHLQWSSPCLPANSGGCGLVGRYGLGGCNSVSVEETSWSQIKAMYR